MSKLEDVASMHEIIAQMEQISEDVTADKQQLIELDRKQHHNRETLRQVLLYYKADSTVTESRRQKGPLGDGWLFLHKKGCQ